ncbi:MAG: MFS transporter [Sphingobium sp.]|nr:MFS transporter [Sphingobium sp.]
MPGTDAKQGNPSALARTALAAASIPMAMLTLPLVVNVPEYFGNALGMNLAVVGTVFMAVRVLDIAVDPLLGLAMDATRTRWGRFRPWLLIGIPVLVAGTAMLFMPPRTVNAAYLVVGLILAYAGWSILSLAQLSLAAGLVRGYADRARIYAWIQAAFLGGVCMVMLLPLLMGRMANNPTTALSAMGWLIISAVVPLTLFAALMVPERPHTIGRHRLGLAGYARLVSRSAVARLVAADLLFGLGFGVASAVLVFFFIAAKGLERSTLGILLIAQMGAAVLAVPLLGAVAARLGKHVTLGLCGVGAFIVCPTMLLVPHQNLPLAALAMAIWGICYGGVTFLPRAMMADAADELKLENGVERTGVLYALLISSWKLGGAFSVGLAFILLDWIGYDPKLGSGNSAAALRGLQALFAATPAVMGLLGALLCWGYPLTPARCAEIRRALDARASDGGIAAAA